MKKNVLLSGALILSKIFKGFLFVAFALLVIIFIHWHLNREFYKTVQLGIDNGGIFFSEGKSTAGLSQDVSYKVGSTDAITRKQVYLNDLNPISFYINYCQILLSIVLIFFIVNQVISLLNHVRRHQPFNAKNVQSFRVLGFLCLSIASLNCLRFLSTNHDTFVSFGINYTLLMFMTTSFILAEIFKEGQQLYEQEKLTI